MNNTIIKLDKIQFLKTELLEVCEAWNLTTEEKINALQICIKNLENILKGYVFIQKNDTLNRGGGV